MSLAIHRRGPLESDRESPADAAVSVERLYDMPVIFIAGALMALGVAMVYSASVTVEGSGFSWRELWNSPLKQSVFAFIGFLVMLIAAHVDYRTLAWQQPGQGWKAGMLLLLALALLVAIFIPGVGHESLGARRAILIYRGPPTIQFQPAELAKVALVIWLAAFLSRPARPAHGNADPPIRHFRRGFIPAALGAGALIALTGIEDYGTAAIMGLVMLALLLVGRARWSHMTLLVLAAGLAAAGLVLIKPHRVDRIRTFLAAAPDPTGAGYQINQALLAIGSGGWLGRGLGAGLQKYGYLPQDNNDFILAIICEELGIVGGIVVVVLFLALLWRGWRIARHAPDAFGRLLALGLTLTICLQAAMNVGVVTNSIPTKGISLPFVSSGGSGVVFLGLAAGLLAAIGRSYCSPPAS
jgi:cell division protein FtsW